MVDVFPGAPFYTLATRTVTLGTDPVIFRQVRASRGICDEENAQRIDIWSETTYVPSTGIRDNPRCIDGSL